MREYETIIVLDPSQGDSGLDEEVGRVQNIITTRGGEIVGVERWGKRKLAYEVNKRKEGYYALIRFKGHGEILSELERRYRLNESMLRHLTVLSEGPPPAPPVEAAVVTAEAAAPVEQPAAEAAASSEAPSEAPASPVVESD